MYQRILVPIDGSETSQRGLQEAIKLAHALASHIRLVHIVNRTPWLYSGVVPEVIDGLLAHVRSAGKTIVEEATRAVRAADVEVDHRLIEAPGERVGEFIVAAAKDYSAQLIVCGTHGLRGLRKILMGSDAEYIVSHSSVPVLLVRAQAMPADSHKNATS